MNYIKKFFAGCLIPWVLCWHGYAMAGKIYIAFVFTLFTDKLFNTSAAWISEFDIYLILHFNMPSVYLYERWLVMVNIIWKSLYSYFFSKFCLYMLAKKCFLFVWILCVACVAHHSGLLHLWLSSILGMFIVCLLF